MQLKDPLSAPRFLVAGFLVAGQRVNNRRRTPVSKRSTNSKLDSERSRQ
jgi:hypothetical protein